VTSVRQVEEVKQVNTKLMWLMRMLKLLIIIKLFIKIKKHSPSALTKYKIYSLTPWKFMLNLNIISNLIKFLNLHR